MTLLHYSSSGIFSVTTSFIHYSSFEIVSEKKYIYIHIFSYYNVIKIKKDQSRVKWRKNGSLSCHQLIITTRYELVEERISIENWMDHPIEKPCFFSLLNLFDAIYQRLLYSVTIHYVIENRIEREKEIRCILCLKRNVN